MATSFEIRPGGALEPAQQREREVALEVALVELVEQDDADGGEGGRGEELPGEEPLGDEADPRPRRGHVLEPDLVARRLAGLLPELLGDAARREPRREPPRLQDDDLLVAGDPASEQR